MTYKEIVQILKKDASMQGGVFGKSGQVFLTGAGGVGKTYTTKKIIKYFKNPLILASTQIAAQNLGGETLHKVFMLGVSKDLQDLEALDREKLANMLSKKVPFEKAIKTRLKKLKKLLSKTDIIVIDEVSMISAQVLDMMYARFYQCEVIRPILFVGDLFQLPPVNRANDRVQAAYIFYSKYFNPTIIELTKIKRTQDSKFAYHQQHIRQGFLNKETQDFLDNLKKNNPEIYPEYKPVILCSTHAEVDCINQNELDKLKTPLKILQGEYSNFTNFDDVNDFPVERTLRLKVGCRVIFCQNDLAKRYYNGMQGILKEISDDYLIIEGYDGKEIKVVRAIFNKYHSEMQGEIPSHIIDHELKQFPVRVAYAITIHKSQGMTIEHLHIKFNRIFEAGQAYVAISRASNTKYLKIEGLENRHLELKNNAVLDYFNSREIISVDEIE